MRIPRRSLVAAVATTAAALLATAPAAHAEDIGGNGNPAVACPNAQTIATTNILRDGAVIGRVEMRWSSACSGNWTRTTSLIGAHELDSSIRVAPSGSPIAWGIDVATQNFSPYLRVAPTQRMCSFGAIVIGDLHYNAEVCSN